MAYQTIWYFTDLPKDVVDILSNDLSQNFDRTVDTSFLQGGVVDKKIRNSKNAWVPTAHWIGGFLWHYISRANRENFLYDLSHIDGENMQYTHYETGDYYHWHMDQGLTTAYKPWREYSNCEKQVTDFVNENTELVRKLSFVLQLSDPDDYEGGNLQILDETGKSYFAPRQRGAVILFDSRSQHRVTKVTSGLRKSIVGWTMGPRWR